MKKNILALFMLSLSLLTACNKADKTSTNPADSKIKLMSAAKSGYKYTDWPLQSNGMLVFRDTTHFLNYLTFLDSVTDPGNYPPAIDTNVEFDQDQILQNVESLQGFTSIRRIAHNNFLRLNEIGCSTLAQVPKEHFISDISIRSLLNEKLDVQIGKYCIHYINENLSVNIDVSKTDLMDAFHKVPYSGTFEDVINIDPTHQYSRVALLLPNGEMNIWDKVANKPTGYNGQIINLSHSATDCLNPKHIVFKGAELGIYSSNGAGTWSTTPVEAKFYITYGDGTASGVLPTTINSGAYSKVILADFSHNYATPGNYTVHVKAWRKDISTTAFPDAELDYPITVRDFLCKDRSRESDDEFRYTPYGGRAWSGKITVQLINNFFVDKTRIICETSSWINSGNSWKQSKAQISGSLSASIYDKFCNFLRSTSGETVTSGKAKHLTLHRTDNEYFWSKIFTKHGINYDNHWYYFDKMVSVCD